MFNAPPTETSEAAIAPLLDGQLYTVIGKCDGLGAGSSSVVETLGHADLGRWHDDRLRRPARTCRPAPERASPDAPLRMR